MAGQMNGTEAVMVNSYISRVAFGVYHRRC